MKEKRHLLGNKMQTQKANKLPKMNNCMPSGIGGFSMSGVGLSRSTRSGSAGSTSQDLCFF